MTGMVTDPNILAQLEGNAVPQPVSDPNLLAQLEPSTNYAAMAGEAALRGVSNVAGIPGAVTNLFNTAMEPVGRAIFGPESEKQKEARAKWEKRRPDFSSSGIQSALTEAGALGNEAARPKTPGQKLTSAAVEGAVGGAAFGPAAVVPSVAGSVAAEGVDQMGGGPAAKFVASLFSAIGTGAIQNMFVKTTRAITGAASENEVVGAMQRQGVTPRSASDVTGSRSASVVENAVGRSFGGGNVIQQAAQKTQKEVESALQKTASSYGQATDATQAGRALERGISGPNGFMQWFKDSASKLYNKIPILEDQRVAFGNTYQFWQNLQQRFGADVNLADALKNPRLAQLMQAAEKDAIANNGQLRWGTIKALRSEIGEAISNPQLVDNIPKGQLKQLYGALTEDMKQAATLAPNGLRAFNRANSFYTAGSNRIEGTLQRTVDARVPEQAFNLAMQGSKQGATDLWALRRSVSKSSPDQWGEVSSAVLNNLGRKAGGEFSLESFLTQWNRIGPEAKAALFQGKPFQTYAKDLDDIATIAKAAGTTAQMANRSNTSGNVHLLSVLTGGTGYASMTGDVVGAMKAATAATVAPWATAKLMTSPRFVKWLATPVGPNQIPARLSALTAIVNQEPDLAEPVREYLKALGANSGER